MPPPAKRQKKNEDDLICPINLNLPLDPVTADDGRIYEREAIEQYIKSNSGQELVSPITREKMGTKLLAAFHVKNTIENMIENGAITGEPAEDWKKRFKEKKKMKNLLKKGEGGNVKAMEWVAINYNLGKEGFKKDMKMAYHWYEKARVAGSVFGMATVGNFLAVGIGVEKDTVKAMMYLSRAVERGSDLGAYMLGKYLANGKHAFPVDKVEARQLLEKALSGNCPHKCMNDVAKGEAQRILDRLVNETA